MDKNKNQYFTIGADGCIVFTIDAIKLWGPYFRKVGIEIGDIHTLEQYLAARRKAAPFFNDHLLEIAQGEPDSPTTLERQVLVAIAEGNSAQFEHLLGKLDKRNKLGLKVVK